VDEWRSGCRIWVITVMKNDLFEPLVGNMFILPAQHQQFGG
jgi:hypothetical protein